MEEMRQTFGASLSDRYTTAQKGHQKMMTDYDKMRKDLLRVDISQCEQRESSSLIKINYRIYSSIVVLKYKTHPKTGPMIGYKIFSINNLHLPLELHKDAQSDHESSSLTVVKMGFLMLTYHSACLSSKGYPSQIKLITTLSH